MTKRITGERPDLDHAVSTVIETSVTAGSTHGTKKVVGYVLAESAWKGYKYVLDTRDLGFRNGPGLKDRPAGVHPGIFVVVEGTLPSSREVTEAVSDISTAAESSALARGVSLEDLHAAVIESFAARIGGLAREVDVQLEDDDLAATAIQLESLEAESERVGVTASSLLATVRDVLAETPAVGAGFLPDADAKYLEQFGGLEDPETGEGSDRAGELIVRQAVVDALAFMTTAQVAESLGIDETRVRHRRAAQTLLSTKVGKNLRFPRWQIVQEGTSTKVVPHLKEIAGATARMHPAELASRMTTPQASLAVDDRPITPVDWLTSGGDVDAVLEVLVDDQEW